MTPKEYHDSTRLVRTMYWTFDMVMYFAEEYHKMMLKKADEEKKKDADKQRSI